MGCCISNRRRNQRNPLPLYNSSLPSSNYFVEHQPLNSILRYFSSTVQNNTPNLGESTTSTYYPTYAQSQNTTNSNNNNLHSFESSPEHIYQLQAQLRQMESLFNNLFQQEYPASNRDNHRNSPASPAESVFSGFPGFSGFPFSPQYEQAFAAQQQHPPEEDRSPPPASNKAIRQIPTIVVTPEDLIDETNRECCICLEPNKLGDKVARLPCGHLFHRPCITDWIQKHNTCPICRYELETDDDQYEKGRKERMSHRKQRFRLYELQRMSIRDLKRLATQLGLEGVVVEKRDLIQRIVDSGKIDVVASADPVEYRLSDLRRMGVGQLKKAMTDGGVFFDPVDVLEKEDMVQIFLNSGRLIVLPDNEEEEEEEEFKIEENVNKEAKVKEEDEMITEKLGEEVSSGREINDASMELDDQQANSQGTTFIHLAHQEMEPISPPASLHYDTFASATSVPSTPFNTSSQYDNTQSSPYPSSLPQTSFSSHSISQLKSFARELNIKVDDCVEKQEMVERIVNAVERTGAPPRQRRRI